MAEIRFRVGGVRAGSAARSAEQAARESEGPSMRRGVQAGSAARMAEEAKRAGDGARGSMPTLSMRAQGGRILHAEVSQTVASGTLPYNPMPQTQEGAVTQSEQALAEQKPAASVLAQTTFHPAADSGRAAPPLADSLPDANAAPGLVNRFTSMLRNFFKPGEPPSITG